MFNRSAILFVLACLLGAAVALSTNFTVTTTIPPNTPTPVVVTCDVGHVAIRCSGFSQGAPGVSAPSGIVSPATTTSGRYCTAMFTQSFPYLANQWNLVAIATCQAV